MDAVEILRNVVENDSTVGYLCLHRSLRVHCDVGDPVCHVVVLSVMMRPALVAETVCATSSIVVMLSKPRDVLAACDATVVE